MAMVLVSCAGHQLAPSITTQPPNTISASLGSSVTLSTIAFGFPSPTVQWIMSLDNFATINPIAGATMPTLTLNSVSVTDAGFYQAVYTSAAGVTSSSPAILLVPGVVFSSSPVQYSTISFDNVASSTTMSLLFLNFGLMSFSIDSSSLQSTSSWFSVDPTLPTIVDSGGMFSLDITCTPPDGADTTPFVDTLLITTSDLQQMSVSYTLMCTAAAQFSSIPDPSSLLTFDSSVYSLSISNLGATGLSVSQNQSFSSSSWFSISSGLPLSQLDRSAGFVSVVITCTPPIGNHHHGPVFDTLELATNDPTQPIVFYTLSCSDTGPSPTPTPTPTPDNQQPLPPPPPKDEQYYHDLHHPHNHPNNNPNNNPINEYYYNDLGALDPALPPPVAFADSMGAFGPADSIGPPVTQPLSNDGQPITIVVSNANGESASVTLSSSGGSGSTALVVGAADPAAVANAAARSNVKIGSIAIDVTLTNGSSVLSQPAQLCFSHRRGNNYKSACLGYIDASGHWQCEDKCPSRNSSHTCGTTSHFTNFAVLLSGGGDKSDCDSFITGSWKGDIGMAAAFFGSVWLLCLGIAIISQTERGRVFFTGRRSKKASMRSLDKRASGGSNSNVLQM